MQAIKWTLAVGALLALLVCCSQVAADETQIDDGDRQLADRPRLFKLLDFTRFKSAFNKHYGSFVEEMSRMRLYLARCFSAFISILRFKEKESTSYKSINSMSDWTQEERDRTHMKLSQMREINNSTEDEQQQQQQGVSAAWLAQVDRESGGIKSEAQVEQKMSELAEMTPKLKESDPSLRELTQVVGGGAMSRRKRDLTSQNDVADLMGGLMLAQFNDRSEQQELDDDWGAIPEPKSLDGRGSFDMSVMEGAAADDTGALPPRDMATRRRAKSAAQVEADDAELIVDHRGCFNEPVFQDSCGSCYVFAAMSVLEWHYCKAHKGHDRAKFSEQYFLDCGVKSCQGGWSNEVFEFSLQHGLERAQVYPYFARRKKCPFGRPMRDDNEQAGFWRLSGLTYRHIELADYELELRKGPILVQLAVTPDFQDYGGGVDDLEGCDVEGSDIHHAMVLVGHGQQDGKEFWLLRNSYSTDWGEQGYYKLNRASNCFADYDEVSILIESERVRFRQNPAYDNELMEKKAKKWRSYLDEKQKREEEEDDE